MQKLWWMPTIGCLKATSGPPQPASPMRARGQSHQVYTSRQREEMETETETYVPAFLQSDVQHTPESHPQQALQAPAMVQIASIPEDGYPNNNTPSRSHSGGGFPNMPHPSNNGGPTGNTSTALRLNHARSSLLMLQQELKKENTMFDRAKVEKTIDTAMADTTEAFLQILQLETMSQHVQEMRDRRMFLQQAAVDDAVPTEEREVARWIADTYLKKTRTFRWTDKKTVPGAEHKGTPSMIAAPSVAFEEDEGTKEIQPLLTSLKVMKLLEKVSDWDFSVFEFVEECGNNSMAVLMCTVLQKRDLFERLGIREDVMINYMRAIDNCYLDNPYHNHIHACDVTSSMSYFLKNPLFDKLAPLDRVGILISASVHDVGHPGHNNTFEINTETELAVTYNDQSVLENYHIALAWRTLSKEDCNFVGTLSKDDRKRFREVLITAILATDMSNHTFHSEILDELVKKKNEEWEYVDWANKFLPVALHTADLGNPTKPFHFYEEWVDRVMSEFFKQGDMEREMGLPISMLCDRFKVNVPAGQLGFINFVIRPWWTRWCQLLENGENRGENRGESSIFLKYMEENFITMQEKANLDNDDPPATPRDEEEKINENEDAPRTPTSTGGQSDEKIQERVSIKPVPPLLNNGSGSTNHSIIVDDDYRQEIGVHGPPKVIDVPPSMGETPVDSLDPNAETPTTLSLNTPQTPGHDGALWKVEKQESENGDTVGPLRTHRNKSSKSLLGYVPSRTTKAYSIVAMSLPDIQRKLADNFSGENMDVRQVAQLVREESKKF